MPHIPLMTWHSNCRLTRALVAIRAGLDHPDTITHLASLDVLPTWDMWNVMHGTSAAVGFHLYLMAQPPRLAEEMIAGPRMRSSVISWTSGVIKALRDLLAR